MISGFVLLFTSMLSMVGEKIAEKTILDPISDTIKKPFENWLNKDANEKLKQNIINKAITNALLETERQFGNKQADLLLSCLESKNMDSRKIQALASCTITIKGSTSSFLPPELIKLLECDAALEEVFAYFLYSLNMQLSEEKQFAPVIAYANAVESTKLLKIIAQYHLLEWAKGFYTTNEKEALSNYSGILRKKVSYSTIPITRSGIGVADVELRQIYVPLTISYNKESDKVISLEKSSWTKDYLDNKNTPHSDEIFEVNEVPKEAPEELDILGVLEQKKNFILLGKPGRGKTTALRKASLTYLDRMDFAIENNTRDFIFPIFFRVRNFGVFLSRNEDKFITPTHASMVQYLDNEYRNFLTTELTPNFFHNILLQGDCAVMMDGIDEVSENIDTVAGHIKEFIEYYGTQNNIDNVFGLSSRPASYSIVKGSAFRGNFLKEFEVQPLNMEGVKQLIINVLNIDVLVDELRNKDIQKLTKVILASKVLFEIASNPLFCTALILVYKVRGAELPQRKVDVFHEIIDLLLGFWRNLDRIDYHKPEESAKEDGLRTRFDDVEHSVDRKRQRLSSVAFKMQFQDGDKSEILATDAIAILEEYFLQNESMPLHEVNYAAKQFLKNSHERSGVLVETESFPRKFTFLHNQFREFLAANQVLITCSQDEIIAIIISNIYTISWEEVIIFIVSHKNLPIRQREIIIDRCIEEAELQNALGNVEKWARCLYLAGNMCINSLNQLQPSYLNKIKSILFNTMTDDNVDLGKRLKSGLNLDKVGWSPSDICSFISLPEQNGDAKTLIAKYPVSNQLYSRFIDSEEYTKPETWAVHPYFDLRREEALCFTDEGLDWIENKGNADIYPLEWFNADMGKFYNNIPVVGVNWFEANAYCKWLLKNWDNLEEGIANPGIKPQLIRLPNEEEWIAAAGGLSPEKRHPWDSENNGRLPEENVAEFSNIKSNNLKTTTPLGMFPKGDSPLGLAEMCGNVWEWQSNYFDIGNKHMAIKGGSYKTNLNDAKVANRSWELPTDRDNEIGFRVLIEI